MTGLLIGFIGWVVGLFLWSNILGSIFATLPLRRKLLRTGEIKKMNWPVIIVPIVWSSLVLIVVSAFSTTFMYGSLWAGIMIIFSVNKLKAEAIESYLAGDERRDYLEGQDDFQASSKKHSSEAVKNDNLKTIRPSEKLRDWDTIKKGQGNDR